jgi:biotin operon repressor
MEKIKLKPLLGKNAHWTLNKVLVRQLGLAETLVLQHIIDLTESAFKREQIFQPINQMADELGITEYNVKQAVNKLKDIGLINVERRGIPYKNYYSVNNEMVMEMMSITNSPAIELKSAQYSEDDKNELNVEAKSTQRSVENNSIDTIKSTQRSVENISTNTKNTTNNTITKNINKEYTTNSFAGINYETLLDNMRDLNNENCADTISFIDTEIGWDTFMNNINYDSSAKQNFMNRIQNNAYNYGIELNFNK